MKKSSFARFAAAAALLFFLAALTGCGTGAVWHGVRTASVHGEESTRVWHSCQSFEGSVVYTVRVSENDAEKMTCSVNVTAGSLRAVIESADGSVLLSNEFTANSELSSGEEFKLGLRGAGAYRITLYAQGFGGSYSFDWGR